MGSDSNINYLEINRDNYLNDIWNKSERHKYRKYTTDKIKVIQMENNDYCELKEWVNRILKEKYLWCLKIMNPAITESDLSINDLEINSNNYLNNICKKSKMRQYRKYDCINNGISVISTYRKIKDLRLKGETESWWKHRSASYYVHREEHYGRKVGQLEVALRNGLKSFLFLFLVFYIREVEEYARYDEDNILDSFTSGTTQVNFTSETKLLVFYRIHCKE